MTLTQAEKVIAKLKPEDVYLFFMGVAVRMATSTGKVSEKKFVAMARKLYKRQAP